MNTSFLVPLGISYYTLIMISYLSDMYHHKYQPCYSLIDFMLFSFYFPVLFIGPINRYDSFSESFNKIAFKRKNLFNGLLRIGLGLIKKLIIANKLMLVISTIVNNSYQGLYVLFSCFIYSILLYNDFSGGIDIVLGVSKIFNIKLEENFNYPFTSETIKEFWRRWHITLGNWLKDYIYIPLGGSRVSSLMTKVNVLITFIISGLWHGIHYVLWGILNGVLVILNFKTNNKYVNRIITFLLISLLWVFFIYNDTFLSLKMLMSIFTGFDLNFFKNILNLGLNLYEIFVVIIMSIIILIYEKKKELINNKLMYQSREYILSLILLIVLIILIFGNYGLDVNSNNFIYGNF